MLSVETTVFAGLQVCRFTGLHQYQENAKGYQRARKILSGAPMDGGLSFILLVLLVLSGVKKWNMTFFHVFYVSLHYTDTKQRPTSTGDENTQIPSLRNSCTCKQSHSSPHQYQILRHRKLRKTTMLQAQTMRTRRRHRKAVMRQDRKSVV